MKGVRIARDTLTVSVALASVAFLVGFVVDQRAVGIGLALGLVVGAVNGEIIQRVIDNRSAFLLSSLLRMGGFGAAGIVVGLVIGVSPAWLLMGIASAQFVMVGAAVRQGLRQ